MTDVKTTRAELETRIKRRAPAMLLGKAMGAAPSVDEALFLASIVEAEEKAMGLPPHWLLRSMLDAADAEEAKTKPYKCVSCGKRWPTSDKRAKCHPASPAVVHKEK